METSRANQGLDPVEFDPVIHGNVNDIDNNATLTRGPGSVEWNSPVWEWPVPERERELNNAYE